MTLSEEKVMDIIKESNISLLSVAYSTRSVETVSIQRLPVFLSAAEHLNFTRAAEEQCISQTAVSQQIKLLEQELGYALFVRGKRGVVSRPMKVKLSYQDRHGEHRILQAKGFFARAVCHELDHLDGVLYIDRAQHVEAE